MVTRGTRFLMNLRVDCGQEVQGAFSELVTRDEPRAGAVHTESQEPTQAVPYSILGTGMQGFLGPGKSRVETEGKQERVKSDGKDSIPHSSLYKEASLPQQFGLCFALARKTS